MTCLCGCSDADNDRSTGGVIPPVPLYESAIANHLALNSDANFLDISGDLVTDFMCQYRAPAPCREGYHYYFPGSEDLAPTSEYGLASCVKLVSVDSTQCNVARVSKSTSYSSFVIRASCTDLEPRVSSYGSFDRHGVLMQGVWQLVIAFDCHY